MIYFICSYRYYFLLICVIWFFYHYYLLIFFIYIYNTKFSSQFNVKLGRKLFFLIIFKHFSAFLQTPKKFILNNSIPAFHQNAGMSIIKIMDIPAFPEYYIIFCIPRFGVCGYPTAFVKTPMCYFSTFFFRRFAKTP